MTRIRTACGALALAALLGRPAAAQLPPTAQLLQDLGVTQDEIAQIQAGSFVNRKIPPSNERELTTAFAFLVKASPGDLVSQLRGDLLDRDDPNTLSFLQIPGAPSLDSFAKLTLQPDPQKRAQTYLGASPGTELNLSSEEIASLAALGSGAATTAVDQAVRSALLARLEAYRAQGLPGIAPYARSGGEQRSPAEDLRSATEALKNLKKYAPAGYQALLDYPQSKPPGTEEVFRWSQYLAHGEPTLALTHALYIPDGDAWVVMQRQFYVSGGYNSEQAVAALLPGLEGTVVVYTNRTSTDQVAGFGGGMKRDIGSRLLNSQLQDLYQKVRGSVDPGGN